MITSVNQLQPGLVVYCAVTVRLDAVNKNLKGSDVLDLIKIIHDLRQERDKLQAIIASLEQLQLPGSNASHHLTSSRRGRRSMDSAGRLEVSRRMKQYWENRRKQDSFNGNTNGNSHSSADSFSM